MKHITEKYGVEMNLLTLTHEELKELEPFLKALGVRFIFLHSSLTDTKNLAQFLERHSFFQPQPPDAFAHSFHKTPPITDIFK